MGNVDSGTVLWGQTLLYTIYAVAVIALVGWFAFRVSRRETTGRGVSPRMFWTFFGLLIVSGVSLHIVTYNTIPWVHQDVNNKLSDADRSFAIVAQDHRFTLPASVLQINCNELVHFDVRSKDLTYGFGLFRKDNSMVFQMQVVPGHRNDLLWKFKKNGVYSIRSTEYSGPEGARMGVKDAVQVVGCPAAT
ncbi:MAG: cytochrome c oxidase subunit II [Thermoleophilia bacterium]